MGRYWLSALLLAGCIDFRQGLACADDRDCVGFQCVSGVCQAPDDVRDDAGLISSDAGVDSGQWFATSTGGRYMLTPVASVTTQAGQRVVGFSSIDARPTLLVQTGASATLENRVWVLSGGSMSERGSRHP
jgi:hypothetical protein